MPQEPGYSLPDKKPFSHEDKKNLRNDRYGGDDDGKSPSESGQFKIVDREARPSIEIPSALKKDIEDKKVALEKLQKKNRDAYEEAYPGASLLDDKKVDAFVAKFNAPKEKLSMIERALAAIKGESKKEADDFEMAVYAVWNRTDVVRNAQSIAETTGFSPQKARLLAAMKATTPGQQAMHSEDFLESLS